jgi:hypothetical protein
MQAAWSLLFSLFGFVFSKMQQRAAYAVQISTAALPTADVVRDDTSECSGNCAAVYPAACRKRAGMLEC